MIMLTSILAAIKVVLALIGLSFAVLVLICILIVIAVIFEALRAAKDEN